MSASDARVQRSAGRLRRQRGLDDLGVVGAHQADAIGDAEHVAVDGQSRNAERVTQDDVRGLASDARQFHEGVHVGGHVAADAARRAPAPSPRRLFAFIRKKPVA